MRYRYFLNSVLINEPQGWDRFVTDIKRNDSEGTIDVSKEFNLTFGVDEYNYFKNEIETQSYCGVSDILIQYTLDDGSTWNEFHRGKIFHTDLKFNEKTKEVSVKVQDNSYYAFINNNKNVGTFFFTGITKNGFTQSPVNAYTFIPADYGNTPYPPNTTGGFEYKCYRLYDCFDYLINFMTDGSVGFQSTALQSGGEFDEYFITTGYILKYSILNGYNGAINPAGINEQQFKDSWKQISFQTLFEEVRKRFNLIYWIEYPGGNPVLRIEKENSARSTNVIPISNHPIDELISEIDESKLYGTVQMGNGAVTEQAFWAPFPDRLQLIGFKDEELNTSGNCNLNSTLNLKTEFIHDANTLLELVDQGWGTAYGDEFNQDIFVFHAERILPLTCSWYMTNWLFAPPPYFPNETLTNANIIKRFFNSIPFSLSQYYGQDPNSAVVAAHIASTDAIPNDGTYPAFDEPIQFSDDSILGYDPFNIYGNGTSNPVSQANSRYTAPYTGTYYMSFQFDTILTNFAGVPFEIGVNIYDSSNVFQSQTTIFVRQNAPGIYYFQIWDLNPIYMRTGWYAQVIYRTNPPPFPDAAFNANVKWRINVNGATIMQTVDTNKTFIYQYKFKVPMNIDELQLILNNLPSLIPFQRHDELQGRKGWIKSLKYNHKDCIADITLVASKEVLYR